jgi:hypothetical protein
MSNTQPYRAQKPRDKSSLALTLVGHHVAMQPVRRRRAALQPLTHPDLAIVERAPETHLTTDRWRAFDEIGLAEKPRAGGIARAVVSTYRLLGFAILSLIVFVLIGYIAQSIFYYLNGSWIAPIAVTSTDEKVVTVKRELATQLDQRERTAAELKQTDRVIAGHQAFAAEFRKAIKGDRDDRAVALERLRQLASSAASTRSEISKTTNAYANGHEDRLRKELEVGLIDRQTALAGKYQLAQIAGANLAIAERQAEYKSRAAELAAQTRALDAIVRGEQDTGALSYDVLRIKREYDASQLELAKALAERDVLKASLARQDQTIQDLQKSAYMRALDGNVTVALVPYGNLEEAQPGTPVFACRLSFVICREVGVVKEVIPGEQSFKHPRRDAQVRGQLVELKLTDKGADQDDVLFVGGKPLGL